MGDYAKRKRILVVSGDEDIRQFCRNALDCHGHSVELAEGLSQALGRLKSFEYDLVISDIGAPGLYGIDLYINILKNQPYLKSRFMFIIGEGAADLTSFLNYIQIGYLSRPIGKTELLEAVGRAGQTGGLDFLEKRSEGRFRIEADCAVGVKPDHGSIKALSLDVSRSGMKVRCWEGTLTQQMEVSVTVESMRTRIFMNATVAWSRPVGGGEFEAGLRLAESLPITSLIRLAGGDVDGAELRG